MSQAILFYVLLSSTDLVFSESSGPSKSEKLTAEGNFSSEEICPFSCFLFAPIPIPAKEISQPSMGVHSAHTSAEEVLRPSMQEMVARQEVLVAKRHKVKIEATASKQVAATKSESKQFLWAWHVAQKKRKRKKNEITKPAKKEAEKIRKGREVKRKRETKRKKKK